MRLAFVHNQLAYSYTASQYYSAAVNFLPGESQQVKACHENFGPLKILVRGTKICG